MRSAIRQVGLLSILALQGCAPSAARSEESPPAPVGIVISGPGFMATVNNLPSDRLLETETSDQAAGVTFNDATPERELTVQVRVVRLSDNAGRYPVSVDSLSEQIFRDDAAATCNGPVRFARSTRPANVASAGAIPTRLEAICETPKDTRWTAVHFVAEALTNRTVRCVWSLQRSSRSRERPSQLPVQDVCIPMDRNREGGTATIRVIRSDQRSD
jgi:hypothetical protein